MQAMRHMVLQPQLSHRTLAEVGSIQNLQHIYHHDALGVYTVQQYSRNADLFNVVRHAAASAVAHVSIYMSTAHAERIAAMNVHRWYIYTGMN